MDFFICIKFTLVVTATLEGSYVKQFEFDKKFHSYIYIEKTI